MTVPAPFEVSPPAGQSPATLLLAAEEGVRPKMYLQRLARLALADAPGSPLYAPNETPHTVGVIHYHAGRCDQSRKRITEHAANKADWTRRLEAVGFSVRPGRCGVVATLELPPTEAVVEPYGEVQDFTDQVAFPAQGVGGLVQRCWARTGYIGCKTTSSTGRPVTPTKTVDQAVVALALHWGLPHHVHITRP
ncbi:hypothetical protein PV516_19135 [Streptomyces scabiei]|uniref:hypothetical protein n=1 Tax=Streptomyces scabiei TaxID=1930 RepID=UPI0029B6D50C|nr:hypothetical protein [Streptomyces scabiei]MDX3165903.1 hypothetical protein [Streptomyces scabiei]